MSNTTISKTILISGLNTEISTRVNTLRHRVLNLVECRSDFEKEMQIVIDASTSILDLVRNKSKLIDSKKRIFNFSVKNKGKKKASVENTKKAKRKR